MMPMYIKFKEHDRLTIALNDVNDDGVEFWLQAEAELVSDTQPEAKASEG